MIVWRITGNDIGPNDCGAFYFATKAEATQALRDYNNAPGDHLKSEPPEKLVIVNREQLAAALNDAMGYGGA